MQILDDQMVVINWGGKYETHLFNPPSANSCGGGTYIDIELGNSGGSSMLEGSSVSLF